MGIPQGVMALLLGLLLIGAFAIHGKPKKPGPVDSSVMIMMIGLLAVIMAWGGFWSGR